VCRTDLHVTEGDLPVHWLRSVTSNTRADAREFLGFAAEHKLAVTVHPYPLDAADRALRDLKAASTAPRCWSRS
jgi:D-arabinose 1-dehydrogenase-like Zn-dependent alcohol dehydrogenase